MGNNKSYTNKKPNNSHSHNNKKKGSLISNVNSHKMNKQDLKNKLMNDGVLVYNGPLTVSELAEKMGVSPVEIVRSLFLEKIMVNVNTTLTDDYIELVALKYGYEVQKEKVVELENFEDMEITDDPSMLEERPPVVTIMGHVDHGKTTLLDAIRKSRVVAGEFGGITQHIGAYQTMVKGKKITFVDTPGHEAFTEMRARGAQITDIVIIVVAADDGVKPQTIEAVNHAKAANVPIIVAVNKMDKPAANYDKVVQQVSDLGLMPEEWGGDTIYRKISAKAGIGLDELLETILLVSELAELKANPNRYGLGTVVEARLDKQRGPIATFLVQNGTLRVGDSVVAGTCFGKVRQLRDDLGRQLSEAGPSTPVEISGLQDVPVAGDKFMAFESEKMARDIADKRKEAKIMSERKATSANTLESFMANAGEHQTVNVIIKADVQGSAEAVKNALLKLKIENVSVNVIASYAGAITESDVLLASASKAIIYGFNVRPDSVVRKKAAEEGVDIRLHNIIYNLLEEMEAAMKGMLKPIYKEVVTGQAEVRQTFKVGKVGVIAGSYVTLGYIKQNSKVRLLRAGIVVYEGKLSSLKRFKDDVKEVKEGYECGMMIDGYNDIKEQDIIEGYEMQEVERK
ncbi:MAG: translation initiation factor IF-2 [Bacilli bacterium]|nr:translation initiation factor IF-2 [Bacilli bacterium]